MESLPNGRATRVAPIVRRAAAVVLVAVALLMIAPVHADEQPTSDEVSNADLVRQIEELKRLLEEIGKLNEEQIRELQDRIAELEAELERLRERGDDDELAELRAEAEEITAEQAEKEEAAESERDTATGRQRNLQAMNPEVSFLGDVAYEWTSGPMKDGFRLLGAEIGFQAPLDPYTRFKGYLAGHQEPFDLELDHDDAVAPDEHAGELHVGEVAIVVEEAYMEWVALPTHLRLGVGKFRQQYGTLNRWHRHALPTTDIPFALRNTFGPEGLVGLGVSLDWQLPRAWASSNGLTLEITNADNPVSFAGSQWRKPAFLLRHTGFFDLGPDSYFDLGLNAVYGPNDATGDRSTTVAGIDVNYVWEPVQRARYRGIVLRGEWIYTHAQEPFDTTTTSSSFYTYLTFKLSRRWGIGFRLDDAELPYDRYALFDPETLEPLEFREGLKERAITPYLTWWQSEFVRLRFQYQHAERDFLAPWGRDTDDKVWVQVTFAAGPHKHESY